MTLRSFRAAVCLISLMIITTAQGQFNIQEKIEQKARERAERKVDQTIDKGFDKTEEGVDKGTREATRKKGKDDGSDADPTDGSEEKTAGEAEEAPSATSNTPLKSYSKFDFVPGENVIAMVDLTTDAIGDFPANWNTNSSAEVVTVEGHPSRWLKFAGHGYSYPEDIGKLPENFTVEFNMTALEETPSCSSLNVHFRNEDENMLMTDFTGLVHLGFTPRGADGDGPPYASVAAYDKEGTSLLSNSRWLEGQRNDMRPPVSRISIQRQKSRLRVYMDEVKVWDLPKAFSDGVAYRLVFEEGSCEEHPIHISDLRVAVGASDTRNKLITEGRFVTRGILFDTGSDKIKGESYGTLKEIATVLKENADVRVKVIGHTDSDGDQKANLDLSKRRAQAVKEALQKEFSIDAGRLETDGKGEDLPAGPNDSPQGKANNRRVEFVKL